MMICISCFTLFIFCNLFFFQQLNQRRKRSASNDSNYSPVNCCEFSKQIEALLCSIKRERTNFDIRKILLHALTARAQAKVLVSWNSSIYHKLDGSTKSEFLLVYLFQNDKQWNSSVASDQPKKHYSNKSQSKRSAVRRSAHKVNTLNCNSLKS